jgi:hypothetical protein
VIPWSALVRHAPALLAAADTLLARSRSGKTGAAAADLAGRLHKLEQSAEESTRLLRDIAAQGQALAELQEQTARRVRLALGLALGAVALAAAALVLVLLR